MTRVLLIGLDPQAVDFSDPDLPPGTTAEKIAAGIEATLADMKARGWEAAFCSIPSDAAAEATIATSLAEPWDCVVVGGGIRIPSSNLRLFERVVDAVRYAVPETLFASSLSPNDSEGRRALALAFGANTRSPPIVAPPDRRRCARSPLQQRRGCGSEQASGALTMYI